MKERTGGEHIYTTTESPVSLQNKVCLEASSFKTFKKCFYKWPLTKYKPVMSQFNFLSKDVNFKKKKEERKDGGGKKRHHPSYMAASGLHKSTKVLW